MCSFIAINFDQLPQMPQRHLIQTHPTLVNFYHPVEKSHVSQLLNLVYKSNLEMP